MSYIAECLEFLKESGGTPLYIKFVEQALSQANISAVKKKGRVLLKEVLTEIYDFALERADSTPKMQLHNIRRFASNREENLTIIMMLNTDMPFILRTLIDILRNNKAVVLYTLHPVIRLRRDDSGKMSDVVEGECDDCVDESIVYVEIERMDNAQSLEELASQLRAAYGVLADCLKSTDVVADKLRTVVSDLPNYRDKEEWLEFAKWITRGNFIFFAYVRYSPTDLPNVYKATEDSSSIASQFERYIHVSTAQQLVIGMVTTPSSMVFSYLNYMEVQTTGNSGDIYRFFGILSPDIQHHNVDTIPIIRKKAEHIKARSNIKIGGHSHRLILNILQGLPRELLFILSDSDVLYNVLLIADAIWSTKVMVAIRICNDCGEVSFVYVTTCAPEKDFNSGVRDSDLAILSERKVGARIVGISAGTREYGIMRQNFVMIVPKRNTSQHQLMEDWRLSIEELLKSWDDNMREYLAMRIGERSVNNMLNKYRFSSAYKETFDCRDAYRDIIHMERLSFKSKIEVELYNESVAQRQRLRLKIYSRGNTIDLSSSLPMIENMSVRALDHHSYRIKSKNTAINAGNDEEKLVVMHCYTLESVGIGEIDIEHIRPTFEETLIKIILKEVENSPLNKLTLRVGMNWRSVFLITAFTAYLQQIGCRQSVSFIQDTLVKHSGISSLFLSLFKARFDPVLQIDRLGAAALIKEKIVEQIATVESAAEDSILRSLLEIIGDAIVRTNFYQDGCAKSYISFKILSRHVSAMPLPKPFAEIFVYSTIVEGVHLRNEPVSRGGLRWSDRPTDYRTEVLGLMKAQVPKNSIIVPSGAKGGFLTKQLDSANMSRDEYMAGAIRRYETFLMGLLDITDNIVGGAACHPANTLCADNYDTYLVVAADKGTATFSDYANIISQQYNFWMGDAFASGGSAGYDHKKMGITARGAWVSLRHHMSLLGMTDLNNEPFTAIGIGDMSGDVFGNGMLLSKKIKLLAAFNHMHIFLDPDPDPDRSYDERARMFALPRSGWDDYDKSALSQGAMVISRRAKNITLTPESAAMLGISGDIATEQLISAILCMEVSMIWNGGIGVYIKSEKEPNDKIGDRTNDDLRINGNQVRAKIIIEGGNLGVTQLGRIEYAKHGGHINTDFIDNCGGVHCSDREVNIKIAFSRAIESKKVTVEDRNKILEGMQDEVAGMVLHDNLILVNSLTINYMLCSAHFHSYCRFVDRVEALGILDCDIEFMPNVGERAKMAMEHKSFTKPELSVLLAYAKIWLRKELANTSIMDDVFCDVYLMQYFPKTMRQTMAHEIRAHPLHREIIANFLIGILINRLCITTISNMIDALGMSVEIIIRSYIIVNHSYGAQWVFDDLIDKDSFIIHHDEPLILSSLNILYHCLEHGVRWIARKGDVVNISGSVQKYSDAVRLLQEKLLDKEKHDSLLALNVSSSAAKVLAMTERLYCIFDVVSLAERLHYDVSLICDTYLYIEEKLGLTNTKNIIIKMRTNDHWHHMSLLSLFDELCSACAAITAAALSSKTPEDTADSIYKKWSERNSVGLIAYREFTSTLASFENVDVSISLLIVGHLKNLVK